MLNRRILRIKAFKVLYSSMAAGNMSLAEAESVLEESCEATRDLYIFMLGIVSPLTAVARERIEAAKAKFNPSEEERNPNMKFAGNRLAALLDADPDFTKIFRKKKFSWEQYDLFLKKIYASVSGKKYFADYMASPESSLKEDCRLFVKIFEKEFVDSPELETILEDMSIYWNDDLAYSLTFVCRSLDSIAKGERWSLPALYMSDLVPGPDKESDKLFVKKLRTGTEKTNVDALIGKEAVVKASIRPFEPGIVRIGGQDWTAVCVDGEEMIAEGTEVEVVGIEGVRAIVRPLKS